MALNFLKSAFRNVIKENFESDGKFYVYHGCPSRAINGIQNVGFERSWTSANGGNMYGKGVYTTYSWSINGQNAHGVYGGDVVKAVVKNLNNFIIYEPNIATRVYGEFNVEKQVLKVFGQDFVNELKRTNDYMQGPDGRTVHVTYEKVINTRGSVHTSDCALALAAFIHSRRKSDEFKTNGYIFFGGHDADVCVIKDFKNIYPVAISHDLGRTYKPIDEDINDKLDKFARNDIDLYFQLGRYNYDLMQELDFLPNYFVNNFARVKKGGKYNFLYRGRSLKLGVISPVWFDEAPETFSDRGTAMVLVGDKPYMLVLKDSNFYVFSKDGNYICKLEDFEHYLNDVIYEDDFDEEF